jgi:hypothetical protein
MNDYAEKWTRYRWALRLGCGSGTPLSLPLEGAERGALRQQSFQSSRAASILMTTLLAACVAAKPDSPETPVLASRYYGTWAVDSPRYPSWWWIIDSRVGATGYVYKKDGTCGSGHAMVLGPDRIDVLSLDTSGNETRNVYRLHLAEGDLLLCWDEDEAWGAIYRRVTPSDICKRADGTYAEGAPSAPLSR